jgi:hypothetical protein
LYAGLVESAIFEVTFICFNRNQGFD